MFRRSVRLESNGYYDSEGQPTISYKENQKRIFRRRKRHGAPMSEDADDSHSLNGGTSRSWNSTMKIGCCVLFLLSMCFGFTYLIPTLSSTSNLDSSNEKSPVSPDLCHMLNSKYEHRSQQVRELQDELKKLKTMGYLSEADSWPNFALESQGAKMVFQKSSPTYRMWEVSYWISWLLLTVSAKPRDVIQGQIPLLPGRCWSFAGDRGHLVIALSHPVTISHVTLGHISKEVSPTGSISSAPKEFSVYGMKTLDDEGDKLGSFLYDQDGDPIQSFEIPVSHDEGIYRYVKLQVDSNWGNPVHTCLYNFRVHGKLADG